MLGYKNTEVVKSELVLVTPEMAKNILDKNDGNRKFRPSVVKRYADEMAAGSWKETGDVIRVSEDGNLLDGQHRLAAIELSGASIRFNVTILRNTDNVNGTMTATGIPLDIHTKRGIHDVVGESKRDVAVARVLIQAAMSQKSGSKIELVARVIDCLRPSLDAVSESVASKRRLVSHSSVTSAFVLRHAIGYDYTREIRAMSLDRFNEVTPLWMSWYRNTMKLIDTGQGVREELLVKAWAVTDPEKHAAKISSLTIRGDAGYNRYLSEIRDAFNHVCFDAIHNKVQRAAS